MLYCFRELQDMLEDTVKKLTWMWVEPLLLQAFKLTTYTSMEECVQVF